MLVRSFDTDVVPPETRLAAFRRGAVDFQIDVLGDPSAFASRWRMLQLDAVNVIHSQTSALLYHRLPEAIATDGVDRFAIHYCLAGGETGFIDGRPATAQTGGAMVWDLALPLEIGSATPTELIIVTLPRYMVEEVLPTAALAGAVPPSAALALAARQARSLIDHAGDLPDAAAVFLSRAIRDIFAFALIPAIDSAPAECPADGPHFQRIIELLDANLRAPPGADALATELGVTLEAITAAAEPFGGLQVLADRRRLLAAYQLLSDPTEEATVEVVAYRCGFNSLSQFNRQFREAFDVSASALRRKGRGNLPRWAGAYPVDKLYGELMSS